MNSENLNTNEEIVLQGSKEQELVIRSTGDIANVIGGALLQHVEIRPDLIANECFTVIDISLARKLKVMPVKMDFEEITIAMADPTDLMAMDTLKMKLPDKELIFVSSNPEMIDSSLSRWNRTLAQSQESKTLKDFKFETEEIVPDRASEDGQMAKIVSNILEQAVSANASDVHFEPQEDSLIVRFRIDGVLQYHKAYQVELTNAMVNHLKFASKLKSEERRVPQDGQFNRVLGGREVDFRIVTIPTAHGPEAVVIRIFDQSRARLTIEEVNFHDYLTESYKELLNIPHGMILVTGPTGSGKTTTLYASLGELATPDRKVLTVEDPVEIRFPGITQVQVNKDASLTFPRALTAFLRADPDIMLVGEIRDEETANLAAQAALTGHLVLSTLHTNEAAGAATRLINLGLEPFVITSALKGVLAQRLLRKICRNCATPYDAEEINLEEVHWPKNVELPTMLWRAHPGGCANCEHTGYKGRLVVGELLLISDAVSDAINERRSSAEVEKIAHLEGMISLHHDAILWVKEGLTSIEETKRAGV